MSDEEYAPMIIPGMEKMFEEITENISNAKNEFFEGKPRGQENRYFDASLLPDAPGYQDSADGANIYVVYVLFPTKNEFDRGIQALTFGARKLANDKTKFVTLDSVHPGKENKSYLQRWEEIFFNRESVTREEMRSVIEQVYEMFGSDIMDYDKSVGSKLENVVKKLKEGAL